MTRLSWIKLVKQFGKFAVVGLLAFIIDYGLLIVLTEVGGWNYLLAATISFTVSVIFNYFASMRYVFKHKEGLSRKKEFLIFVILSVIGLIINDIGMFLGVTLFNWDYRLVKIGVAAIVTFWNFTSRKIFLDAG